VACSVVARMQHAYHSDSVLNIVVPHVQNALFVGEKCAHFSALYCVNALHVFLGFTPVTLNSNFSFYWQSHNKVLCFEIES